MNQDKGQAAVRELIAALREGTPSPFSLDELLAVTPVGFAIHEPGAERADRGVGVTAGASGS